MNFKEKKILFIGPKFHNYEMMIKEELKLMGANVDFFSERSYGFEFNIVNNFFNSSMQTFQARHYNKIWKTVGNQQYDFLFVIRGYMITGSFLKKFKKRNPNSKIIMYQWDSQRTNPFSHLIELFDVVKSFDFQDCEEQNIEYLPLFYTKDVKDFKVEKKKYEYDFFFMGFFFEERYDALLKFKEYCIKEGYKLKPFLFMPFTTRLKYFLKGKKLDRSIVSFKHMNRLDYLETLSKSNIMVDVSNPRQTGLAMRVIESLACNTKVATNNGFFKKDVIIKDSGMITLFDLNQIDIDRNFLKLNFNYNNRLVLSLEEWLKQIFFGHEFEA